MDKTPIIAGTIIVSLGLGIVFGLTKACNTHFNHKSISGQSYRAESTDSGYLTGHVEYIRYKDCSQEVTIFESFQTGSIKNGRDLDGDGLIDIIKINGAYWGNLPLKSILVRKDDYLTHKKEFDEADKLLKQYTSPKE